MHTRYYILILFRTRKTQYVIPKNPIKDSLRSSKHPPFLHFCFRPALRLPLSSISRFRRSRRFLLFGALGDFVHGAGLASRSAGGTAWEPVCRRWGGRAPCGFTWEGLGQLRDALDLHAVKCRAWVTASLWVQAGSVCIACCWCRLGWVSGGLGHAASGSAVVGGSA